MSETIRAHPAEEVYVTGTFDNWSKSEKMAKVGDSFEKSVELPDTSEKIYYKVGAASHFVSFCLNHLRLSACFAPTSPLTMPGPAPRSPCAIATTSCQ